jgi:predicted small lipoprotein YifL
MRAGVLLALLLLSACGEEGPPLFPDGTPATAMVDREDRITVTTSAGWQKP